MKKNRSIIDKMALEAIKFVDDYCNMIDCCDDCIFLDEEKDLCCIKHGIFCKELNELLEKRKKEGCEK